MCTHTMIELSKLLLTECGFTYFIPGRLTSDAMENEFSIVRKGRPKPNVLEFANAYRESTLCQFFEPIYSGNYDIDDHDERYKLDFLSGKKKKSDETDKPMLKWYQEDNPREVVEDSDTQRIEKCVFHNECGYMVNKINEKLKCERCKSVLCCNSPCMPEHEFTRLKEYSVDQYHMTYLTPTTTSFFNKCEEIFLEREPHFSKCSKICKSLKELYLEATPDLPSECHPLRDILCGVFAITRLNMYVKIRRKSLKDAEAAKTAAALERKN